MKNRAQNIILIAAFLVGLSLLLYPPLSNYWNSFHQSMAIADYATNVSDMDLDSCQRMLDAARLYNESLADRERRFRPGKTEHQEYMQTLKVGQDGMMGYVEIPSLHQSLAMYHTTEPEILQVAVGHIEGSSLPVGGRGTHCVLSGHRGLPSAKLFSDLDRLKEGDTFLLKVLDQEYTYEVDQIHIVDPMDISDLVLDPDEDYCTLVTCTPYGINTHRLLVRGRRIEAAEGSPGRPVPPDAAQISPLKVIPFVAVPLILLFIILPLFFEKPSKASDKGKATEK